MSVKTSTKVCKRSGRLGKELDDKMESFAKVINTITSSKKILLQNKLLNLLLKKEKLAAISADNQELMSFYDVMIAKNEIDLEIESITRSRKYRRKKKKLNTLRICKECDTKQNTNNNCTSSDASTSVNTIEDSMTNIQEENINSKQNTGISMHDKTTNTDQDLSEVIPVMEGTELLKYKYFGKENISVADKNTTTDTSISNSEIPQMFKSKTNIPRTNLLQSTSKTMDNNETLLVQPHWFENSFDITKEYSNYLSTPKNYTRNASQVKCASQNTSTLPETSYSHVITMLKKSLENGLSNINTVKK